MDEFENDYAGLPLHKIFKIDEKYSKEQLDTSFYGLKESLMKKRRGPVRVRPVNSEKWRIEFCTLYTTAYILKFYFVFR